jgi:hypothetical protein
MWRVGDVCRKSNDFFSAPATCSDRSGDVFLIFSRKKDIVVFMSEPLMILVAGPYRSGTNDNPELIRANVDAMTDTALKFPAGSSSGARRVVCSAVDAARRVPADRR